MPRPSIAQGGSGRRGRGRRNICVVWMYSQRAFPPSSEENMRGSGLILVWRRREGRAVSPSGQRSSPWATVREWWMVMWGSTVVVPQGHSVVSSAVGRNCSEYSAQKACRNKSWRQVQRYRREATDKMPRINGGRKEGPSVGWQANQAGDDPQ